MRHLENGCQYFKGSHVCDDLSIKNGEIFKVKEIAHRFFVDAKDMESVTSFSWDGNTFLLAFSRISNALFAFNLLIIGSEEECKAWKVRLEVVCPKDDGKGLVGVIYEGPPGSINKGSVGRRGLPWECSVAKSKSRGFAGAAISSSLGKKTVAGVVVSKEMISNVDSIPRGRRPFFDLKIMFQKIEEAE